VQRQGKTVTKSIFSSSFKYLKTAVDWVNKVVNFRHGQSAVVTCYYILLELVWNDP